MYIKTLPFQPKLSVNIFQSSISVNNMHFHTMDLDLLLITCIFKANCQKLTLQSLTSELDNPPILRCRKTYRKNLYIYKCFQKHPKPLQQCISAWLKTMKIENKPTYHNTIMYNKQVHIYTNPTSFTERNIIFQDPNNFHNIKNCEGWQISTNTLWIQGYDNGTRHVIIKLHYKI